MKRILYFIIAAAAILAGCNTEIIVYEASGVSFDLECKTDYTPVVTVADSKASSDDDIINALSIDIERQDDGWKKKYAPYSTVRGTVIELAPGSYNLTASSPEKKDAAFDQPIFEGTTEFEIMTGRITELETITCEIRNTMVTICLSENFVNSLSAYTVTVSNGKGNLSWNKNPEVDDFEPTVEKGKTVYVGTKAGYFTPSSLTVTVHGILGEGFEARTTKIIADVNAAEHHKIYLDANVNGGLDFGDDFITVSHDVNPITKEFLVPTPEGGSGDDSGDDSGNDDSGDSGDGSDAPYLVWDANPDFSPMNIDENLDADLVIHAPGKIAEFLVIVDSEVLSPTIAALCSYADDYEGGEAVMNLLGDDVLIENLANMGLGLPLGDEIEGKTEVPFSLSGLIPLIDIYQPEAGAQHKFTLKVTDEADNTYEKLLIFVSI